MILWILVLLGPCAACSSPNAVPSLLCCRSPPAHALARLPVLALRGGSDLPGGGADAQIVDNQEKTDWITFLTSGHLMTEEEVEAQIKTPAVLQAFERAKLSNLPADVRAAYDAEVREHDRYSQHIAEQISKGEKSAKIDVARNLLAMNITVDQIEKATGLSSEDIKGIK